MNRSVMVQFAPPPRMPPQGGLAGLEKSAALVPVSVKLDNVTGVVPTFVSVTLFVAVDPFAIVPKLMLAADTSSFVPVPLSAIV